MASAKGEVSPVVAGIVILLVVAVAVVVVLYGLGYLGGKKQPGILPVPGEGGGGGETDTGCLPSDETQTAEVGGMPHPCAGISGASGLA